MIALDVGGLLSGMFKLAVVFAGVTLFAVAVSLTRPDPVPASTQTAVCQAQGGWWVAATYDRHGTPKMFACVDDAGRLLRVTEAE